MLIDQLVNLVDRFRQKLVKDNTMNTNLIYWVRYINGLILNSTIQWLITFLITSALSGVIGNLVYDLLKHFWRKKKMKK